MYLVTAIVCYAVFQETSYFTAAFISPNRHLSNTKILMVGDGKDVEKVQTKKEIFRDLREKLNDAAQIPGFSNVGQKMDVELYCKSTKDGMQISDCREGQFVQMVLLKKGIPYIVMPTLDDEIPNGISQLPALVHKGEIIVGSLDIAEFIERTYPHTSLTRQGIYSYQEVLEKTENFLPALTAFLKNKDDPKDLTHQSAFELELDIIDEILRATPGQFLCGVELTLADLYIVPQLFHAVAAIEHFKEFEFYNLDSKPVRPALESYISKMFDMEEFNNKKSYYSVDKVIHGWKIIRGDIV